MSHEFDLSFLTVFLVRKYQLTLRDFRINTERIHGQNTGRLQPNAAKNMLTTLSHLPLNLEQLGVNNVKIGTSLISVSHEGTTSSTLKLIEGENSLVWKACFSGKYNSLMVNGIEKACRLSTDRGLIYSYIEMSVKKGEAVKVECILSKV